MSENFEKKLKDLSSLSNLLETYALYHRRRSIGNFYIFISATVSIFLFLGFILSDYVSAVAGSTYGGFAILFTMMIALILIFYISVNYFKFVELYKPSGIERKEGQVMWLWIPLSIALMFYMSVGNFFGVPSWTYPFSVNVFVGLGNLVNYFDSKLYNDYPGKVQKEYLYNALILFIGSILIIILPDYGWLIVTVTALMGAYAVGIYITVTAEKVFIEAGVYGERLREVSEITE